MYLPVTISTGRRSSVLIVETVDNVGSTENAEAVAKELCAYLEFITQAALKRMAFCSTSSSFSLYLGLSKEDSQKAQRWDWSVFEKSSTATPKNSLQCMIKLVQYLIEYGQSKFPQIFEETNKEKISLQRKVEAFNQIVTRRIFEEETSIPAPPTTISRKRKASNDLNKSMTHSPVLPSTSTLPTQAPIALKKRWLLQSSASSFTEAVMTEKPTAPKKLWLLQSNTTNTPFLTPEKVMSKETIVATPSSTTTAEAITLLAAEPQDIIASDDETSDSEKEKSSEKHFYSKTMRKALSFPTSVVLPISPLQPEVPELLKTTTIDDANKDLLGFILPIFSIEKCPCTPHLIFQIEYGTRRRKQNYFLLKNAKKIAKKNLGYLSTMLTASPKTILIRWKNPLSSKVIAFQHTNSLDFLIQILQGLQAFEYFLKQHPCQTSQVKIKQEALSYSAQSIQLLEKHLKEKHSLSSSSLLEHHISSEISLTPIQISKELVKQRKTQITLMLATTQPISTTNPFFMYLFSITSRGSTSKKTIELSYNLFTNKKLTDLKRYCHQSLNNTLDYFFLLQEDLSLKKNWIDPETQTVENSLSFQDLWEKILEGLLENQQCLQADILHYYNDQILVEKLQKAITLCIQHSSSTLHETKKKPIIIPSLIEKNILKNPTHRSLYSHLLKNSSEKFTKTSTEKFLETIESAGDIDETSEDRNTQFIINFPSRSTQAISSSATSKKTILIPCFSIFTKKTANKTTFQLTYIVKQGRYEIKKALNRTRQLLTTTLTYTQTIITAARKEGTSSQKLIYSWKNPLTNIPVGISQNNALSLIFQGLQNTLDYHRNKTPSILQKTPDYFLEPLLIQQIKELQLIVKDFLPSLYSAEKNLMHKITQTHAKKLSTLPLKTSIPIDTSDYYTLYFFCITRRGKKRDGSFGSYTLFYASRKETKMGSLYAKCRDLLKITAEQAISLLSLETLPPQIKMNYPDQEPHDITSLNELHDLILEGLQENWLFYNQYANTVITSTTTPVKEILAKALDFAKTSHSSDDPDDDPLLTKTTPTIILQALGDHIHKHPKHDPQDKASDNE